MVASGRTADGEVVEAVLDIGAGTASLEWPQGEVSGNLGTVKVGLGWRNEAVRRRRNPSMVSPETFSPGGPGGVRGVGRLVAESVLPAEVMTGLVDLVAEVERNDRRLILGIDVAGELACLPWEAIPLPKDRRPIALHPLVDVHRLHPTVAEVPARALPGPLRVVMAIASPLKGGGKLLNYEGEARALLRAVRGVRRSDASVVFVRFATLPDICAALVRTSPHVLHITGHGSPGFLDLEDEVGSASPVEAHQFVEAVEAAGARLPPVVTLAACHTDLAEHAGLTSFAAELVRHTSGAVIATAAPIKDEYATLFLAKVYRSLERRAEAEVVAAVSNARREIQQELEVARSVVDRELLALDEWATVTVLGSARFRPRTGETLDPIEPVEPTQAVDGQAARPLTRLDPGGFVGRRREQRQWPAEILSAHQAGLVMHGIGGVGKTALASELVAAITELERGRLVVQCAGPVNVDRLFGILCHALRAAAGRSNLGAEVSSAVEQAARPDLPTSERLAILRAEVWPVLPMLVVLDNFEDNQSTPTGAPRRPVRDAALARMLADWIVDPGDARLVITTRHPLVLPDGAEQHLVHHHLGPLTYSEARKFMWALPRLDALDERDAEEVWRLLGGHPRSMEHLDALLTMGNEPVGNLVPDLTGAVQDRFEPRQMESYLAGQDLDAAMAAVVARGAAEIMLDKLLAELDRVEGARRLLVLVSVFRRPVERFALEAQIAVPQGTDGFLDRIRWIPAWREKAIAACEASGLLHCDGDTYLVHRWTATLLTHHVHSDELLEAHRRAAEWWRRRFARTKDTDPEVIEHLVEARHHYFAALEIDDGAEISEALIAVLHMRGAWDQHDDVARDTLRRLPPPYKTLTRWLTHLASSADARGDLDRAEQLSRDALRLDRLRMNLLGLSHAHHLLGVVAQRRGNFDEAVKHYRSSLMVDLLRGDEAGTASSEHVLGQLAMLRGEYDEAERLFLRAHKTQDGQGNEQGVATTLLSLGSLAHVRGDRTTAMQRFSDSLVRSQSVGLEDLAAAALLGLGDLFAEGGDLSEAEEHYRKVLGIHERHKNALAMATAYRRLGALAQARGDYGEAEARFHQALAIEKRVGSRREEMLTLAHLGALANARGDVAGAEPWLRAALSTAEALAEPTETTSILLQLAELEQEQGRFADAKDHIGAALEIAERFGLRPARVDAECHMANLARARGRFAEAEVGFRRCIELGERWGLANQTATAVYMHALVDQDLGNYSQAQDRYLEALNRHREVGLPREVASVLHQLGMLAEHREDYEEAESYFREALDLGRSLPDLDLVSRTTHHLGGLALARGDRATARALYLESLTMDRAMAKPSGVATSYHALAELARLEGDQDEAFRLCRQALRLREELGEINAISLSRRLLAGLFYDAGQGEEAESLLHDALGHAEQATVRDSIAGIEYELGMLARLRGDHEEAEPRLRRALQLRVDKDQPAEAAEIRDELGVVARLRGDLDDATALHEAALATFLQLGNRARAATVWVNLAEVEDARGRGDEAQRLFELALEARQQTNDIEGAAFCQQRLAGLALERNDLDGAEQRFRRSLEMRKNDDARGIATDNHNLGIVAGRRGDHVAATRFHSEALRLWRELGNDLGISRSLLELASVRMDRGEIPLARQYLEEALAAGERCEAYANVARASHQLSVIAGWSGEHHTAEELCGRALAIYEHLGDHRAMAMCMGQLGIIACGRRRWKEAEHWHRRALETLNGLEGSKAIEIRGVTHHLLGIALTEGGRLDEAEVHHERALDLARQNGNEVRAAQAYQGFALIEWRRGRPAAAIDWHLAALAIVLPLEDLISVTSIDGLIDIRAEVGRAAFTATVADSDHNGGVTPEALNAYLDKFEPIGQEDGG